MNRDIKFRAWHNRNEVMIENAHIYDDFVQMIGSKKDTYTVMQFTGLHDKNNNPIYEGDIVEADGMESVLIYDYSQARKFVDSNIKDERKWEHRRSNYIVYWQDNFSQFNFKPVIPGHSINTDIGERNYEIVGNIYESPLIK